MAGSAGNIAVPVAVMMPTTSAEADGTRNCSCGARSGASGAEPEKAVRGASEVGRKRP